MKRVLFFLIVLFSLMPLGAGHAQDMVKAVDSLDIDLWPDYDRASVLVLLTGTLPGNTPLPATVTLPLPENARLNAVARIDGRDGQMYDDILWVPGPGALMFTLPDLRFRMEYYLPYKADNNQRSFDFTWLADLSVDKLKLKIQQPASASSLQTKPAAGKVIMGEDGFTYHIFPERNVPAGQPFKVLVDYKTSSARLSVQNPPAPSAGLQTPGTRSAAAADAGINWPMVAIVTGILIIVIVFVWQIVAYRSAAHSVAPLTKGGKKPPRNKFCQDCGAAVNEEDQFCRKCGTGL